MIKMGATDDLAQAFGDWGGKLRMTNEEITFSISRSLSPVNLARESVQNEKSFFFIRHLYDKMRKRFDARVIFLFALEI